VFCAAPYGFVPSLSLQIGPGILKQVADAYRKLRGTLRFLLGNLSDFNPATDAVAYQQLPAVDRQVLRPVTLGFWAQ
jgi:isoleucyl-tRNA synthetase